MFQDFTRAVVADQLPTRGRDSQSSENEVGLVRQNNLF